MVLIKLKFQFKVNNFWEFYSLPAYFTYLNSITALLKDIMDYFGNSIKTIECDGNRQLVMSCFDSLCILINGCSAFIRQNLNFYGETLEKLGNIIINAFKNKIFCQTIAQDDDGEDQMKLDDLDENQAEYDYMIKEYTGDLVLASALCLPDEIFDKYFEKVLHFLHRIWQSLNLVFLNVWKALIRCV